MPKKKAEVTDATKRYNAMKMSSGGGPTIERHGMNRALDSTPTAQMRQELAAAGVEVPSDDALSSLSARMRVWIEAYRLREGKNESHTWFNLFTDVDKDGDGQVTYDELLHTIRRKLKQPPSVLSDVSIQALWCALDCNDSNAVEPQEMAKFLRLNSPTRLTASASMPTLDHDFNSSAAANRRPASAHARKNKSADPLDPWEKVVAEAEHLEKQLEKQRREASSPRGRLGAGFGSGKPPWEITGGKWSLAGRDASTIALMEKKRLELAANAPNTEITYGPGHMKTPAWAMNTTARPSSAPAGYVRKPHIARRPPSELLAKPPPEVRLDGIEAGFECTLPSHSGGGSFWPKGGRDTGTIALIERKRLELAANAPDQQIGPSSCYMANSRQPSWAILEKKRLAESKAPSALRRSHSAASVRSTSVKSTIVSQFAVRSVMTRPAFWPPLDVSDLGYSQPEELLELLTDTSKLSDEDRAIPRRRAYGSAADEATTPPPSSRPRVRFETLAIHASHNRLTSLEQLPMVLDSLLFDASRLISLDLSFNKIEHLPPTFSVLTSLEVLRLHHNRIGRMEELAHLQRLPALSRLTLNRNPLEMQPLSSLQRLALKHNMFALSSQAQDELSQVFDPLVYRLRVLAWLPQLRQLDQMACTQKERSESTLMLTATKRPRRRPASP